ncbi:nitroreductase family protein [Virgibacillus soli]|uniref:nitroreductase family protein n=1 Tax=Paracerasibacillus soli TaxID=480284 RepID=UPI0035EE935D
MIATIDTALIAQNVITAAESLGYGGCYIGGVRNNPDPISRIVGLPDKVSPLFELCLGIPTEKNRSKAKPPVGCYCS